MNRALVLSGLLLCACAPLVPVSEDDAGSETDAGGGEADSGVTLDAGFDGGAEVDSGVAVDAGEADAGYEADPLIVARPFAEVVPTSYLAGTPTPLVVQLHGYSATAVTQDLYFQLSSLAQTRGFLLALPDGTRDGTGNQFWNATDACCGFGATVDDVAYVTAVIEDMKKRYSVDSKRVFLIGHSNGAFMSHRMACERAELIAGIIALAGNVWKDASHCTPSEPVHIAQLHGTLDAVISYYGGAAIVGQPLYPAAEDSVATWAGKNGCTGSRSSLGQIDLLSTILGNETDRLAYGGCPGGGAVELWKINGGSHLPGFNSSWGNVAYNWLLAHPKP